jgi:hypothetical protein
VKRKTEDQAFDDLPFEVWWERMHPGEPIPDELQIPGENK